MKETWIKKMLSMLLVIAVVVSSLSSAMPMSYVNATSNSGYTEYTFTDLGLEDGTISSSGNVTEKRSTKGPTTWDKVAISGYVASNHWEAGVLINTTNTATTGARIAGVGDQFGICGKGLDMYNNAKDAHDGKNKASGYLKSSATVPTGEEAYIRVELKADATYSDVLQICLYVNEAEAVIVYFKYQSDSCTHKLAMRAEKADQTISWRSVEQDAPEEPTYAEYTFTDLGLEDGTISSSGNAIEKRSTKGPTTWDKVAISGYVASNHWEAGVLINTGNVTTNGARIAGVGDQFGICGKGLDMYNSAKDAHEGKNKASGYLKSSATVPTGEEAYIRVELKVDATYSDVLQICLYVNEAEAVVVYFKYQSESCTHKLAMRAEKADQTISWRSVEDDTPEEPAYTEYTFTDLGLEDGTISSTGSATEKRSTRVLTTWDKVAISGYVASNHYEAGILINTTNTTTTGARIAGVGDQFGVAGKGLDMYNNAKDAHEGKNKVGNYLKSSATVPTGEEAHIRVELKVDAAYSDVLQICLYVNEAEAVIVYFKYQSTSCTHKLAMRAEKADQTISWRSIEKDTPEEPVEPNPPGTPEIPEDPTVSNTPQKALSEYEMLTFSDLGIGDATFANATKNCNGKLQDWDGKVFTGMVTFPANGVDEKDGIITLGGTSSNRWTGLRIGVTAKGALYIRDASGPGRWEITPTTMNVGTDVRGREIKLSVTITRTSANSAYVGVYVNDHFCGERLFADLKTNLGATLMAYSSGATMKIASVTIGLSDTPQKDISEYKMLTFSDFGINNGEIVGSTKNCRATITNLNGKLFQGKVTFPTNGADAVDGILTIGGTASNRWEGLRIGVSSDGKLYILEGNNPAQRWNIAPETMGVGNDVRGQELEIGLTFTYADARNVYVGLYVNSKFCGEKLFKNLTKDFGGTLMVYSKTAKIKVASSETPWTKFLKSDVNFAYFGFTDKWDKELTSIYKGGK